MNSANQPPGEPDSSASQRQPCRFWSSEVMGSVTILRFSPDAMLAGVDLQSIATFWSFLQDLFDSKRKFLHVSISNSILSQNSIFGIYEYFQGISSEDYLSEARDYRRATELTREDIAIQRFIRYLRDDRVFVVSDIGGEIDINYLGILLACDYRIAREDTVIVNSGYPLGRNFGTATPWFLARLLGPDKAMSILLNCEQLSSRRAYKLGIFHQLIASPLHAQQAMDISQKLAAQGTQRLLAAKRAVNASATSLNAYFDVFGAGIGSMDVETPCCQHCGYILTGNISGKCPECGTAIEHDALLHSMWSTRKKKPT